MKKLMIFLAFFWAFFATAQTFYVDPVNGEKGNPGSELAPFHSLEVAVSHVNTLTGSGEIRLRLQPGIYSLNKRVDINPVRMMQDTARFIIEAVHMPDDVAWDPVQMPVIQSVSGNNSETQFVHATGLLVSSAHVTLRGLKFLGNANPAVGYYYPVSKENPALADLEVSQCMFIGDKEAAKIQGGIWAHGPENTVSHCVFYGCRNGILFFNNVEGFTIEHSIIYGSYESAFWFSREDFAFTFRNNIIANNACFLVMPPDLTYSSPFTQSLITNNDIWVGAWSRTERKVVATNKPGIQVKKVDRSGKVSLLENLEVKLEKGHLQLAEGSEGKEFEAGIFKDKD